MLDRSRWRKTSSGLASNPSKPGPVRDYFALLCPFLLIVGLIESIRFRMPVPFARRCALLAALLTLIPTTFTYGFGVLVTASDDHFDQLAKAFLIRALRRIPDVEVISENDPLAPLEVSLAISVSVVPIKQDGEDEVGYAVALSTSSRLSAMKLLDKIGKDGIKAMPKEVFTYLITNPTPRSSGLFIARPENLEKGVSPTKVRKVPQDSGQLPGRKGFSTIPNSQDGT